MPSALSTRVERAISTLLDEEVSDNKNNIAIDVLRSLANQSALLLERQIIWDTIDSDPLEIFDSNNNADDDDNKADSQNDDPDDKQNEKCEEGNKMSRKEVERLKVSLLQNLKILGGYSRSLACHAASLIIPCELDQLCKHEHFIFLLTNFFRYYEHVTNSRK